MNRPSAPALEPLDAPFDQFQRYTIASEVARALATMMKAPPRVLDVGGHHTDFWGRPRRPIAEFLPESRSVSIDLPANPLPGYVRARGDGIPFAPRSFHLVCSVDVLEHVPPPARKTMVREATRVASRAVLLAAPFASPVVERAEALVAAFIRRACHYEQGQLQEHRELGLPDLAATLGDFDACGWTCRVFEWGSVWRWATMMVDKHAMLLIGGGRELQRGLDRQYNERHFDDDSATPSYRQFILATAQPDDPLLSWAERRFAAVPAAAAGSRPAVAPEVADTIFEALEIHATNQELRMRLEPERRDSQVHDLETHRDQLAAVVTSLEGENRRLESLLREVEGSFSYRAATWLKRVSGRRS